MGTEGMVTSRGDLDLDPDQRNTKTKGSEGKERRCWREGNSKERKGGHAVTRGPDVIGCDKGACVQAACLCKTASEIRGKPGMASGELQPLGSPAPCPYTPPMPSLSQGSTCSMPLRPGKGFPTSKGGAAPWAGDGTRGSFKPCHQASNHVSNLLSLV